MWSKEKNESEPFLPGVGGGAKLFLTIALGMLGNFPSETGTLNGEI